MRCKQHRTEGEIKVLVGIIDRNRAEGIMSVERSCRNLGVPTSTYYGWKAVKGQGKPASVQVVSTHYNPRTESILVDAGY